MKKKRTTVKLKKDEIRKLSINQEKLKVSDALAKDVRELVFRYVKNEAVFDNIKEQLEDEFQTLFKSYPTYDYFGYSTQLGMLNDLVIHYKLKGE